MDDFNEYQVTAINTSTNALTIRLKDDPSGVGLQTAIPDDSKLKEDGNMMIYSHTRHITI